MPQMEKFHDNNAWQNTKVHG